MLKSLHLTQHKPSTSATRIASTFGAVVGLAGIEHGFKSFLSVTDPEKDRKKLVQLLGDF